MARRSKTHASGRSFGGRRGLMAGAALATVLGVAAPVSAAPTDVTLVGYASLPAGTFAAGPPSGACGNPPTCTTPVSGGGFTGPFASQPVQGFSGIVDNGDGTFQVMPDNGYGSKGNSADFRLRIYTMRPHFEEGSGALPAALETGSGNIDVLGFVDLRDPDGKIPFPIVNGADPARSLTGADFDIESIQRTPDGTYWIGDEFGPFLLHFDASGVLLDAPIELPDVTTPAPGDVIRAADNPNLGGGTVRAQTSGGFEGLALSPDGTTLYPLLEKPLVNPGESSILLLEFDVATKTYTGDFSRYAFDAGGVSIGDFILSDATHGLIIERDNNQGVAAAHKKIYGITLPVTTGGSVTKDLVVDLMAIHDPDGLSLPGQPGDVGLPTPGNGMTLSFPFTTIEDVVLIDANTIGVLNDNNFPFGLGRNPANADNDEFLVLSITGGAPDPVVPEAPIAVLLPTGAALLGGAVLLRRHRSASRA